MQKEILPEFVTIHNAIHNPGVVSVNVGGKDYPIGVWTNHCRYVEWNGWRVMTQRYSTMSDYAKRAREGEKITWAIPINSLGHQDRTRSWIPIEESKLNKMNNETPNSL